MTTPPRPTNDELRAQIIAGTVNPASVNTRELLREVVAERDALLLDLERLETSMAGLRATSKQAIEHWAQRAGNAEDRLASIVADWSAA